MRTTRTIRRTGLIGAAAALIGAGCARMPTPPIGSAEPVQAQRDWAPTAPGVYLDGPTSRVFIHDDDARSRRTLTPTDDGWRVEVVRLADPGGTPIDPTPWRTVELVRLPDHLGSVGMRAIEEHPDPARAAASRVVFDPPIPLLPPNTGTDEAQTETVAATLTRGNGRPEHGQARRTVRLGGTDRLPGPDAAAHADPAQRLEATLDMRFGPVRIRRAEILWAHPGRGISAESSAVVVSYAGVPVDRRSSLARLEEPQPGN